MRRMRNATYTYSCCDVLCCFMLYSLPCLFLSYPISGFINEKRIEKIEMQYVLHETRVYRKCSLFHERETKLT